METVDPVLLLTVAKVQHLMSDYLSALEEGFDADTYKDISDGDLALDMINFFRISCEIEEVFPEEKIVQRVMDSFLKVYPRKAKILIPNNLTEMDERERVRVLLDGLMRYIEAFKEEWSTSWTLPERNRID